MMHKPIPSGRIRAAGFAIAFNPNSPELEEVAGAVVRSEDLRDILPHLIRDAR